MTMLSVTLIEVLKVVRKPLANPTCLLLESNTKDNTLSIEGDNINNHIVDKEVAEFCVLFPLACPSFSSQVEYFPLERKLKLAMSCST